MAFKRVVKVLVGEKDNESTEISDLKIEFECTKSLSDNNTPNAAKITVWNCNDETAKKLSSAGKHLILQAGYEDEVVGTIFVGDIVYGNIVKEGGNRKIEIEAAEAREAVVGKTVNFSFAKNSSLSTVAKKFTDELGYSVKGLEKLPNKRFEHGYSFMGNAADGLKEVLSKFGWRYTMQNEMLFVFEKGKTIESQGLELSAQGGLLTTPSHISDKTEGEEVNENAKNRWQFRTLLFPQLMPGAVCKVKSVSLNGDLMIEKATFAGDNFDGDFAVEVEGVENDE